MVPGNNRRFVEISFGDVGKEHVHRNDRFARRLRDNRNGQSYYREGCPILPGSSMQKTIAMTPSLENISGRYGVAVEDQIVDRQNLSLASSVL